MNPERFIMLSFDVEEFDMPLEYGHRTGPDQQLEAGYDGLVRIKRFLEVMDIPVTLFTTANFAEHYPHIINELSDRHEIASHTYYHSSFEPEHLRESRIVLEKITGKKISGLRMPRMKNISAEEVMAAGYRYDSSINPTWLPGRYNNLNKPRSAFRENGLVRIPASVSNPLRFPLFWLGFKALPYVFYLNMVKGVLKKDGYACLYFHPWEFIDLDGFRIPPYTRKPCGEVLVKKLERLVTDLKKRASFITMENYVSTYWPSK